MKVYVGTYHKYNCGSIDGKWFDLNDYGSYEDFEEDAREYHKDEEDPELMFQDYEYEDDFDELFEDDISHYYEALEEIDRTKEDREFVTTVANHLSWSGSEVVDNIRNISDYAFYVGSMEEYFTELCGEQCSDSLRSFINWEEYAKWIGEDFEPYQNGYIVFTNC